MQEKSQMESCFQTNAQNKHQPLNLELRGNWLQTRLKVKHVITYQRLRRRCTEPGQTTPWDLQVNLSRSWEDSWWWRWVKCPHPQTAVAAEEQIIPVLKDLTCLEKSIRKRRWGDTTEYLKQKGAKTSTSWLLTLHFPLNVCNFHIQTTDPHLLCYYNTAMLPTCEIPSEECQHENIGQQVLSIFLVYNQGLNPGVICWSLTSGRLLQEARLHRVL